jgi:hypothetical protein
MGEKEVVQLTLSIATHEQNVSLRDFTYLTDRPAIMAGRGNDDPVISITRFVVA